MPQTDEGQITVSAELPIGTRIERTQEVLIQLEDAIREHVPEAINIITSGGGGGFRSSTSHRGNIDVQLVPKDARARSNTQIAMDLRRDLGGIPGVILRTRPSGGNWNMSRMFGRGSDARLTLEIRGFDLDDASRLAKSAKNLMESIEGVTDVEIGREEGRPELAIDVDRPKAALLGLTVSDVANTLQTNIAGTQAALFRERGKEYPIIVRLREEDRANVSDVDDILVSTPTGAVLQAKNLMTVTLDSGPMRIDRMNQERITTVNAEIETSLSDAVQRIQARLPELNAPADFAVGFGAEVEEQGRAFSQLQLLLLLGVLLVYAVMASQFESLRDPFIIMFAIPLAAIGVIVTLKVTGTSFSMQAYVGVIMLAGIVVNNAILLVDYTNTLRRRDGLPLRDAVEQAGRTRLRPIMMTSLTTILGLLPMSFGFGEGGELQAPLARVVIGGLATSTLITLLVVPSLYTLFEEGLSTWRLPFRPVGPGARGSAVGR